MHVTTALINALYYVVSFVGGFGFYYLISPVAKKEKKQQLEQMANWLINFIIYLWIAKILLKLSVFIRDPLAVLAYPSNSAALYVAVFFTVLHLIFNATKKKINLWSFLHTFTHVFIFAAFCYEMMQIRSIQGDYSITQTPLLSLTLLFILLLALILLQRKVSMKMLSLSILLAWSFSSLILLLVIGQITVFNYLIHFQFLSVLIVGLCICLFKLLYERSRK